MLFIEPVNGCTSTVTISSLARTLASKQSFGCTAHEIADAELIRVVELIREVTAYSQREATILNFVPLQHVALVNTNQFAESIYIIF